MPASETVIADTSPLLNLALIDELGLVDRRWDTVTVPGAVWDELTAGEAGLDAIRSLRERGGIDVVDVEPSEFYVELRHELDRGEAAAITLAVRQDPDVLLLDEREARAVARRHDLSVTGAIGVLLWGARRDLVEMEAALDSLQGAGFWINDELYERAIARASEREED